VLGGLTICRDLRRLGFGSPTECTVSTLAKAGGSASFPALDMAIFVHLPDISNALPIYLLVCHIVLALVNLLLLVALQMARRAHRRESGCTTCEFDGLKHERCERLSLRTAQTRA